MIYFVKFYNTILKKYPRKINILFQLILELWHAFEHLQCRVHITCVSQIREPRRHRKLHKPLHSIYIPFKKQTIFTNSDSFISSKKTGCSHGASDGVSADPTNITVVYGLILNSERMDSSLIFFLPNYKSIPPKYCSRYRLNPRIYPC